MTSATGSQVVDPHRAMYRGMLDRDTALLDEFLAADYRLTHMTGGFVQPKREWLEQIDSGRMRHHSAQPRSTTVDLADDTAVLVGRDVVDATIWGSRGTWHLQLITTYQRRDGARIAYGVSGLGRAVEVYTASCRGATIGDALAVRGEEAADSRPAVDAWLRRVELSHR